MPAPRGGQTPSPRAVGDPSGSWRIGLGPGIADARLLGALGALGAALLARRIGVLGGVAERRLVGSGDPRGRALLARVAGTGAARAAGGVEHEEGDEAGHE